MRAKVVEEVNRDEGGAGVGKRWCDTRWKKIGRKRKGEICFGLRKTENRKEKVERRGNFSNWTINPNSSQTQISFEKK